MIITMGYNLEVAKDEAPPVLSTRGAFLLSQIGFHVAVRCAEILEPIGLQPAHYGVLVQLTGQEGFSQQQLADAMGVHRNVMVGLIDELEERDLVRRERHPRDRRAHQLQLTDRAHAVLAQANAAVDELEDEIFAGLGSREHSRLITLLQRIAKQADLPDSIHPDLRRRRRANVLSTGDRRA
jgi:DNA-binding MarR family transcriptional regulator